MKVGVRLDEKPFACCRGPCRFERLRNAPPGAAIHQLGEGRPVNVRWPHLEALLALRARVVVAGEAVETAAEPIVWLSRADLAQRAHQKLERGEPLLPVDDQPGRDLRDRGPDLIEHDGAEEVWPRRAPRERAFREIAKVLPQGLPLLLSLPYIGSLVERNEVAALGLEEVLDGDAVGFHRSSSLAPSWR
jgi:hypothetical protein